MGCCVSKGRPVRSSSEDDLEAGQQNLTLRYVKNDSSTKKGEPIFASVNVWSLKQVLGATIGNSHYL